MKKLLSAALVAVLALSNVASASCIVNSKVVEAADEAACTAQMGTWTTTDAAATPAAAPAPAVAPAPAGK